MPRYDLLLMLKNVATKRAVVIAGLGVALGVVGAISILVAGYGAPLKPVGAKPAGTVFGVKTTGVSGGHGAHTGRTPTAKPTLSPKPVSVPSPSPTPTPAPTSVPSAGEIRITAYTSAYTYYDNTPAGSAEISNPCIHQTAGGVGTYADPITLAVGHSIIGGKDILDYPACTKFYIPNVRRYFIAEDACGDGSSPQNGPCHKGYPSGTSAWVDMWIDGQSGKESAVNACSSAVTDANGEAHLIIENPVSNYAVVPGPVFQGGQCTAQFGNTPVAQ